MSRAPLPGERQRWHPSGAGAVYDKALRQLSRFDSCEDDHRVRHVPGLDADLRVHRLRHRIVSCVQVVLF